MQVPSSSTAGNGGGNNHQQQPLNNGVSETTIANAKQPYVHHFRIAKKKTTLEFKMVDAKDIRKNMYGAQNRLNHQQQELLLNSFTASSDMNVSPNDQISTSQQQHLTLPDNSSSPQNATTSQQQHFNHDKSRKPRAPSLFSTNSKITKKQQANRRNSTIMISDPTGFLQQVSPTNNNNYHQDTNSFSQSSSVFVSSNKNVHPVNNNRRKSTTSLSTNETSAIFPPTTTNTTTTNHPQHSHSPIYNNTINSPPSTPSQQQTAPTSYFTTGFSFGNSQKDEYTPPMANTLTSGFSNFKNSNETNSFQDNLYGDAYVSTLTPEQRRYLMQGARRTFATLPSIEEMTRYDEMRRNSIEELTQNFSQVSTSESPNNNNNSNNNNQRRPSTDSQNMLVISENFRNDQRFRRRQTYAFDTEHFSSYDNSCLESFNFPCKPPTNFQPPNSTPNNHPQSNGSGSSYPNNNSSADNNHPYYLPPLSKLIHE